MNDEYKRLQTFSTWPIEAPVDAIRIARGGFYATGRLLETQCHFCGIKINDWSYGDQVMEKHRHFSPDCPFVVNPFASGNVPINTKPSCSLQTTPLPPEQLLDEQSRMATFENWPVPFISAQKLAKAGFYYFNESDHVRCAYCQGVIAKWEAGDDPFAEHLRFFPTCSRAQLGPNVEIQSVASIPSLGIQPIATPKKEKYSSLDARIRSFANWPAPQIQSPETLAAAGFYYQEEEDQVHCFQCNGGLRAWNRDDDPWYEHARWFSKCEFILLVKGAQYVEQVQALLKPSLDDAMSTEMVQNALSLGFTETNIRNVIKQQLEKGDRTFRNAEELVNVLLEHEDSHPKSVATTGNNLTETNGEASTSEASTSSQSENHIVNATSPNKPNANGGILRLKATEEKPKLSLEEENRLLKDARLCKVCMDEDVAVVFLPCGHLVTCVQCAPSVSACPLCRTAIKAFVRTFIS